MKAASEDKDKDALECPCFKHIPADKAAAKLKCAFSEVELKENKSVFASWQKCSPPKSEQTELVDLGTFGSGDSTIEAEIKDATPEEEAKAKEVLAGSELEKDLAKEDLTLDGAKMLTAAPSSASSLTPMLIGSLLIAISML